MAGRGGGGRGALLPCVLFKGTVTLGNGGVGRESGRMWVELEGRGGENGTEEGGKEASCFK